MLKGRRFTPALIVAMIALAVALSGTAVAGTAKLITGSQIANGTITLADLHSSAKTALKGQRGATGAQGCRRRQGCPGAGRAAGCDRREGRQGRHRGERVRGSHLALLEGRRQHGHGSGVRRRRLRRDRHGRLLARQGRARRWLPVHVAG